jgi:DNA-binding FadR family transcriptional regulator
LKPERSLSSPWAEDGLRRRCTAGEWKPGERLPAVADLAQHYGVARNTVAKALRHLMTPRLEQASAAGQPETNGP